MNEAKQIFEYLQSEVVRTSLLNELKSVVDFSRLNYEISFIPTEYFIINKDLMAKPYVPSHHYLIEGNLESKELDIPPYALKVTSMLRPKRESIQKYLETLSLMGVKKVFFQPFLSNGAIPLSLYKQAEGGGIIVRIGDIKESDLNKAQE